MGILDAFRKRPESAPEVKASATGAILTSGLPDPRWMDRNYKSFAKEAYQLNVVGYQAIDRLARSAAAVKWTVWRGDTEIIAGPLNDLLARPNTMMTGPQYVQSLVGYWMLSGNRYQERVMVGSQPRELYVMRPDRMKIRPGQNGSVGQYVFELNGARHAWDADPITGDSDILHEKMFNPLDDWYGMSPIEAGAYAIDQHNETMRFAQSVMQNSARPSGALVTSDGEQLSDEQFNRLKQSLEDQYQGSRNAGRPMLLEGGLSWQSMGMSPHEIEMLEGRYAAARDICLSLGVPPLLLNIPGDSTYSNYSEARQAFWEDTVMPMCEQIAAGWTNWIGEMFGGLEVRPDFDHIPAIVEKHRAKWDMANASTDLTINERRALKGYEPIDGGDTILIGSGQINLEDAGISFDENGLGDGA